MVRSENKGNYLVPGIISIVLLLVYLLFGPKFFLAALALAFGGFLSLINIRIAIYTVTFLYVFLPNSLGIASFFGVGFVYFVRTCFAN